MGVDQVTRDPSHPYTRKLIASIPTFEPGWLDRILESDIVDAVA